MPKASSGATFRPCPTGTVQAVCVDVIDLGKLKNKFPDEKTGEFKELHKIDVVFQVDERKDDGERFHIKKRYTLSFHPKSNLRKDVETWRGKPYSDDELTQMGGFEANDLIDKQALVGIVHNVSGDNTYANITTVNGLMKGMANLEKEPYVRREPKSKQELQDDSEIPF